MKKMIAFCGIDYGECPAYIATLKDDEDSKKKVAEEWSTDDYPLKPEDINCLGCRGNDVLISFTT